MKNMKKSTYQTKITRIRIYNPEDDPKDFWVSLDTEDGEDYLEIKMHDYEGDDESIIILNIEAWEPLKQAVDQLLSGLKNEPAD